MRFGLIDRVIKEHPDLKKAKDTGMLARFGRAGRLAKIGGWFYTAVELAVILYVAEKIEHNVNARIDLAKARSELSDAGKEWLTAVNESFSEIKRGLQ